MTHQSRSQALRDKAAQRRLALQGINQRLLLMKQMSN